MDFPLTPEMIEQVIFAMEDQQHEYYIHRSSGELLRADEIGDTEIDRDEADLWAAIPDWQPVHGFLLMERFVARLRNPLLRNQLKEALASGRGVFRKFKDILRGSREVERLWFTYKECELKKTVWNWYNEQRELAGLERLEEQPGEQESLEDLLGIDFAILPVQRRHLTDLRSLDERAFADRYPEAEARSVAEVFAENLSARPEPDSEESTVFVAETPEKDFAAFIWAVEANDPLVPGKVLQLQQLAVMERYRGMGLAAMLLRRLIAEARDRGYYRLRSELSGTGMRLAGLFKNQGFYPISQVMEIDPGRWEQ